MLVLAVEQHVPGTVKFPVYVHEPHLLLMGKSMRICKIFSSVQTCGRNRFCCMPDNILAEMLRLLQSPLAGVSSPVWAGLGLVAGAGQEKRAPVWKEPPPLDSPGTDSGRCCLHPALLAVFRPCEAKPCRWGHCPCRDISLLVAWLDLGYQVRRLEYFYYLSRNPTRR